MNIKTIIKNVQLLGKSKSAMLLKEIEFFLDFILIMDFTPTHAWCELYVVNPPPCPYNLISRA